MYIAMAMDGVYVYLHLRLHVRTCAPLFASREQRDGLRWKLECGYNRPISLAFCTSQRWNTSAPMHVRTPFYATREWLDGCDEIWCG